MDSLHSIGRDYVSAATDYLREKGLLIDAPYEVPSLAPLVRLTAVPTSVTPASYLPDFSLGRTIGRNAVKLLVG